MSDSAVLNGASGALSPLANVVEHCREGIGVCKIPFREKGPKTPDWQLHPITELTAPDHFGDTPMNFGAILGLASEGLQDVDLDCAEARELAPHYLPPTRTFGRRSNPTSHYFYRCPDLKEGDKTRQFRDVPLPGTKGNKTCICELRSTPSQTVLPGSVHESGEHILWDNPTVPIAEIPRDVLERAMERLAAASLLKRYWPELEDERATMGLAQALHASPLMGHTAASFMMPLGIIFFEPVAPDPHAFPKLLALLTCPDETRAKVGAKLREWLGLGAGAIPTPGTLFPSDPEETTIATKRAPSAPADLDAAVAAIPIHARVKRARIWLAATGAAVSGQNGHGQAFGVAVGLVRRFALPLDEALRLFRDEYSPRCDPPWSDAECEHKIQSASEDTSAPLGESLFQAKDARLVGMSAAEAMAEIQRAMAEELPTGPLDPNVDAFLERIGRTSAPLSDLAAEELSRSLIQKIKVPVKPARKLFQAQRTQAVAMLRAAGVGEAAPEMAADGTPVDSTPGKPPGKVASSATVTAKAAVGQIFEELDGYEREDPKQGRLAISNFTLHALRVVDVAWGLPGLEVRVVGPDGSTLVAAWTLLPDHTHSKRDFVKALPHASMIWTGDDNELHTLVGMLHAPAATAGLPHTRATDVLGRLDLPGGAGIAGARFVLPAGILSAEGWMKDPDCTYAQYGAGSTIVRSLPKTQTPLEDPELLAALARVHRRLFDVHDRAAMLRIVGWAAAAPFAGVLRDIGGGFPHLNLFGSPGSGKSSVMTDLVWRLFAGVKDGALAFGLGGTAYATVKDIASSNGIFLFLDEVRRDLGERRWIELSRLLRRVYNGESESRGRADRSLEVLNLIAPLALAGESRLAGDPALEERLVPVGFDRNFVRKHPESYELYKILRQEPLGRLGTLLLARGLSLGLPGLVAQSRARVEAGLGGLGHTGVSERVRWGMIVVQTGLDWWAMVGRSARVGEVVEDVRPEEWLPAYIADMYDLEPEDVAKEGAARDVGIASHDTAALRDYALALREGSALAKRGHAWLRNGTLALHLGTMEAARDGLCKALGRVSASPGLYALRKTFREILEGPENTRYVVALNERVCLTEGDESTRARCLIVHPHHAALGLVLDGLGAPKEEDVGIRGGLRVLRGGGAPEMKETMGGWRLDRDKSPEKEPLG